jgi:hypothetical protein
LDESEKELETGIKVVSIIQTITEELDDEGRRMLRKILGIDQSSDRQPKNTNRKTGDD